MKVYSIDNKTIGNAKEFFSQHAEGGARYSSGANTKSIDGTGINESAGAEASEKIVRYIDKKFNKKMCVLDAGAGKGNIQKYLSVAGHEAYSMEGSALLVNHIVCDKSKYAIVDLCQPIQDARLHKAFHLSTSFELIEHIHPEEEEAFWTNLIYMSYFHLCSIHGDGSVRDVAGEILIGPDPEANIHCNLKTQEMWKEYFASRGIKYEILGFYPKRSLDKEEFRREVQLKQWNEWESCSFWLLDFRGAN